MTRRISPRGHCRPARSFRFFLIAYQHRRTIGRQRRSDELMQNGSRSYMPAALSMLMGSGGAQVSSYAAASWLMRRLIAARASSLRCKAASR